MLARRSPRAVSPMDATPASAPLLSRFTRLAALNIFASITVPLAGLVDAGMLGHLDDLRFLGGVALGAILFDFAYWSLGFLRMSTTGTTAQAVGAARSALGVGSGSREVDLALYRPLLLGVALGGLFVILQVPAAQLGFALLDGTAGVEAAGRDYFFARIWGAPATLANFAFLGWFLGREESGRALVMTLAANVVNVAANYVLILELGWAARGAGVATALGQYTMLGVAIWFLWRVRRARPKRPVPVPGEPSFGPRVPRLPVVPWSEILERRAMGDLLALNRDILVRTLCLVASFALFTNLSASFGTVVLAANTLLLRVFLLASHAVDGVAYATEALAGIFRGAGDRVGLGRLVRLALASGTVLVVPFVLVVLLAPGAVFGLLTSHREAVEVAVAFTPWLAAVLATGAAAFVFDGLFLGLTAGRELRNSMLLSFFVAYLPLALASTRLGEPHLIWLALVLFMGARTVTLGWMTPGLLGRRTAEATP